MRKHHSIKAFYNRWLPGWDFTASLVIAFTWVFVLESGSIAAELPLQPPNALEREVVQRHPGLAPVPHGTGRENIYFVTNRSPTGAKDLNNQFGSDRADPSHGFARVAFSAGTDDPTSIEAEVRHLRNMTRNEFAETIRRNLAHSGKIIVLVHGYNNSFNDVVLTAARLKRRIETNSLIIVFSWPSVAGWLGFLGYIHDIDEVDFAAPLLKQTLLDILRLPEVAQVQIVVHSLGARALVPALNKIYRSENRALLGRVSNIVFAAPDIEQAVLDRDFLPILETTRIWVTLYVSNRDYAMWWSEFMHGNARAGSTSRRMYLRPKVETIDVSLVDKTTWGHSTVFEAARIANDLHYLLNHGVSTGRYGLKYRSIQSGQWWVMYP